MRVCVQMLIRMTVPIHFSCIENHAKGFTLLAWHRLLRAGMHPTLILPPLVPEGPTRMTFSLSQVPGTHGLQ